MENHEWNGGHPTLEILIKFQIWLKCLIVFYFISHWSHKKFAHIKTTLLSLCGENFIVIEIIYFKHIVMSIYMELGISLKYHGATVDVLGFIF